MLHLLIRQMWVRARERTAIALSLLVLILVTCIIGNAVCFSYFDDVAMGDALWTSVISITTIGYGDFSASSWQARLATIFFIVIVGLRTFSLALSIVFDYVTQQFERSKRGMGPIISTNHVIIVNIPSLPRVIDLIEELRNDPAYEKRDVVLIADGYDVNPIDMDRVYFVAGNPMEEATLHRARVQEAHQSSYWLLMTKNHLMP